MIGKPNERFSEIINITATIERLLSGITWFSTQADYAHLQIKECHPATSDTDDGNDLVLVDRQGNIKVKCEVCDVVSNNAGSNGKEKKDIHNLGCTDGVPNDGIDRFICTSTEFADALKSSKRKWQDKPYHYQPIPLEDARKTYLLKILANENFTPTLNIP